MDVPVKRSDNVFQLWKEFLSMVGESSWARLGNIRWCLVELFMGLWMVWFWLVVGRRLKVWRFFMVRELFMVCRGLMIWRLFVVWRRLMVWRFLMILHWRLFMVRRRLMI